MGFCNALIIFDRSNCTQICALYCHDYMTVTQDFFFSDFDVARKNTCPVPVLYLSRTCSVPFPYLSRTCPVPVPYLSRTCSVPVPYTVPYLSPTCPVPVPYLSRTCSLPVLYLSCTSVTCTAFGLGFKCC